jgi:rubrerythrin
MDTLTVEEVRALQEALDDEYHAWASYDQVISDFGPVRPFVHIRDAEARHALALSDLFVRYGQPLPANTWRGRVARHASLQAACEAAVAAEVANAEMYERLLASTQRPDIQAVLRKLQQASQQRHLPAFQRCAQRGPGGCGAGRRRRGAPP